MDDGNNQFVVFFGINIVGRLVMNVDEASYNPENVNLLYTSVVNVELSLSVIWKDRTYIDLCSRVDVSCIVVDKLTVAPSKIQ